MGRETWYVIEDGAAVDPAEVKPDAKGVLRHKSGAAVAYSVHGPRSRSVDPDDERLKVAAEAAAKQKEREKAKDMKPQETARGYKTR
jgi:hypothetical protein